MNRPDTTDRSQVRLPPFLPIFPLPETVVLPGFPIVCHVFEDRQVALIRSLLARPPENRWLALPRLATGWQAKIFGEAGFHEIAVASRLLKVEARAPGRFDLLMVGVARCSLEEVASRFPFRVARASALPDDPTADGRSPSLEPLLQAALALMTVLGPAAEGLDDILRDRSDPSVVVYRLAALLMHDPDRRQSLLEERSLALRIELVTGAMTELMQLVACRTGALAEA